MTERKRPVIPIEYAELLDAIPQLIFIVAQDKEIIFANKSALKHFETPGKKISTWTELVALKAEPFVHVKIDEALNQSCFFQHNFVDSNAINYSLTVDKLDSWAEKFHGSFYIVSIIPRLRQVDDLSGMQRDMSYQALLDAMPDLIFLLNSAGEFISYRAPNSSNLALPPDAFLGKKIEAVLPLELSSQTRDHLQKALLTGELQVYEYTLEVPLGSGNIRYFESRMTKCGTAAALTIIRDTTERQLALEKLVEREEQYRNVVENSNDGICALQDGVVKFANPQISTLSGYPLDEIIGCDFLSLIQPAYRDMVKHKNNLILSGEEDNQRYETTILRKDQTTIDVEFNISIILFQGHRAGLVFVRDISERKKAEEELLASLREKDVLLREVHHRVKNNLQIVSSLLHLQSTNVEDEASRIKIIECQARVRSMALIHTKLYQSDNISRIDFASYVKSLVTNLYRLYGRDENEISFTIEADDVQLDLETAIPCGLIVNELFSNSLKHAFPISEKGHISLQIFNIQGTHYEIIMSDNGVGFPQDFAIENAETLGLTLVRSLVEQLEGTLEIGKNEGTLIKICFKPIEH